MTTKTIFRMYVTIMLVMKVTSKVSIFSVKLNVYFVSFAEGQGYCPFHSENIREPLAASRRRPPLRGSGHPCGVPFRPCGPHFTPTGFSLTLVDMAARLLRG